MAKYMIDHELTHYSQWFPGKENAVADVLSWNFEFGDAEVVELIKRNLSHHIPQDFRLVPLPEAIVTDDVGSLLRLLPRTQLSPSRTAPSEIAAGGGSRVSSMRSGIGMTLSSFASSPRSESKPSQVSLPRSGKGGQDVRTTETQGGQRRVPDDLMELARWTEGEHSSCRHRRRRGADLSG